VSGFDFVQRPVSYLLSGMFIAALELIQTVVHYRSSLSGAKAG
jgi:hypothetical protein